MQEIIKEKYINNSIIPITLKSTETRLNQMKNSICKIKKDNTIGTGFFCTIPYKSKLIPFLVTNEHVLNNNDLKNNIVISLKEETLFKNININIKEKRIIYVDKELDVTLIEIKPNLDGIDKNNFLEIDNNVYLEIYNDVYQDEIIINNIYSNKSIYLLYYQKYTNKSVVSYGLISKIKNTEINHLCCTDYGSSGSPILSIENNRLIGIHFGMKKADDCNLGKFIASIIFKLNSPKEINELLKTLNISIKIKQDKSEMKNTNKTISKIAGENSKTINQNLKNPMMEKGMDVQMNPLMKINQININQNSINPMMGMEMNLGKNPMMNFDQKNQMGMNQNSINPMSNFIQTNSMAMNLNKINHMLGMTMMANQMIANQLNKSDESFINLKFIGYFNHKKLEDSIYCKKNDYLKDVFDRFCHKYRIELGRCKLINSSRILNLYSTVIENNLFDGNLISFIDDELVVFC